MQTLPDVTSDAKAEKPMRLQWVGMEDIAVPIQVKLQNDKVHTVFAKANTFVGLEKAHVKGIHMSRLHSLVNQLPELELNKQTIQQLLDDMVSSQGGVGTSAKLDLSFEILLRKPALLSNESGYQTYPIRLQAEKALEKFTCDIECSIPYSSTCPCSASLARQLYANAVNQAFPDSTIDKESLLEWVQSQAGMIATPHSQRSYATINISIGQCDLPDLSAFIFQLEDVIGTPVQTAVKRIDEQEFARLNASNLMFCEDAARRIKHHLEQLEYVEDYWFKVDHQESLHAHNAVVIDRKS